MKAINVKDRKKQQQRDVQSSQMPRKPNSKKPSFVSEMTSQMRQSKDIQNRKKYLDSINGGDPMHVESMRSSIVSSEGEGESSESEEDSHSPSNQNSRRLMKKRRTKRRRRNKKQDHKVNCQAWGCTCQFKPEKKKKEEAPKRRDTSQHTTYKADKDYGNKHIFAFPSHPKQGKLQTQYPRLYRWDKTQQQKVKMGLITKEEYLRQREENFAQISDSDEEKKELTRINSLGITNQVSKKSYSQKEL